MAAHLLATPTIADGVWTSEPRLPRETRSDFVRRVLLGETPESMTGPRKPRKASWRELPPAEMAAHLLATPTITDGVWTSEPRLPREKRSDFVRRVLLGETPESEPETPEAEPETPRPAAEPADVKRGYYLLNTDGGNRGDPLGRAAIGALLRTRRLVTVAQISKAIGPATHNVAEYQALIEGLKLAREYGIQRIRVYMDSEIVVDQVNGVSAVRQAHLSGAAQRGEGPRRSVQELPHQLGASGAERRGRPTRERCSRRAARRACIASLHQLSSRWTEERGPFKDLGMRARAWPACGARSHAGIELGLAVCVAMRGSC